MSTWNEIRSGMTDYFKIAAGILIFALIVGGILSYLTWRKDPFVFRFNPESDYVYSFQQDYLSVNYHDPPDKSVTIFSDGFNPICIRGCKRPMSEAEVKSNLILPDLSGSEEEEQRDRRFLYLEPGNLVNINFDMEKGGTVEEKYPYVDSVILETEGGTPHESIKVVARGYKFGDRKKVPEKAKKMDKRFTFEQPFGDSSVFELPEPVFASQVIIEPDQESDQTSGIRGLGIYLERSDYRSIIANLEEAVLEGAKENKPTDLEEVRDRLEVVFPLDPYSPQTHYLLSRVDYELENYTRAREEVNSAIEKKERYEEFLTGAVNMNDLFALKARVAEGLENWEEAIDYMKRTVPEVDHQFLSRIYLRKYERSEEPGDLKSSFYHSTLSLKEVPRTCLEVLAKYKEDQAWLDYGLRYFGEELPQTDEGSYLLSGGEVVSPYVINLSRGLLGLWSRGDISTSLVLEWLEEAGELAPSEEKVSLVSAVKSKVYESIDEKSAADRLKDEAASFFGRYHGLYDDWANFLG